MTGKASSRRSIVGIIFIATASLFGLTVCEQSRGEVRIDTDDYTSVVEQLVPHHISD